MEIRVKKRLVVINDIEVSTMVGVWSDTESERCAFSGTFDGDGNTITSNQYHASGLVGFSKGTNNSIEDCVVTASVSGSKYVGGIVGHAVEGVTIDKTYRSYDNGQSGNQRVRFIGTYKSTAFDATDNSILLMGGNNTLYYPTTGAGIGAQRAYFKIGDGTALARLTNFNIDFGDGETTTGIISIENGQLTIDNSAGGWYSLDGRRLDSKPTKKGVYINNGKKTVIK